jgi:hypothetical protein
MTTLAPVKPPGRMPPLHDSQLRIAKDPSRFKVVCCGRRWGKTVLGITLCIRAALKKGRVWWVAPTYKQALEGWTYLQQLALDVPTAKSHVSELSMHFPGGGSIQIRTADNPDNLRGAGLDGVVLDEAATMKREAWDLVLRPALADKQGWALFISTPQHFNWFYDLYDAAEKDETGTWAAWQHPTWDNPFIPEKEIEAAQRDMLPEDFDQEFGASFTAVGGAVFRELAANRQLYLRPMPADLRTQFRRTGIGKDWGTTEAHQSAVVCGGSLSSGVVWIRSWWESGSGSANDWYDEDLRCQRDYGATFARVDRSQSSAIDHLVSMGFEADKGVADVEGRIGDFKGLIQRKAIFFDSDGPGVREGFNKLCAYHRDKDGKIVEEADDGVDAGCYLVSELVRPRGEVPSRLRVVSQRNNYRQPAMPRAL